MGPRLTRGAPCPGLASAALRLTAPRSPDLLLRTPGDSRRLPRTPTALSARVPDLWLQIHVKNLSGLLSDTPELTFLTSKKSDHGAEHLPPSFKQKEKAGRGRETQTATEGSFPSSHRSACLMFLLHTLNVPSPGLPDRGTLKRTDGLIVRVLGTRDA